ncbi:MAG: hypothetical protein AAF500_10415 [Myxococcota bacterium]
MAEATRQTYTVPALGIAMTPEQASNVLLLAVLGLIMVGSNLVTDWLQWVLPKDPKRPGPASLLLVFRRPSQLKVQALFRAPLIAWATISSVRSGQALGLPILLLVLLGIERSPWILEAMWHGIFDRPKSDDRLALFHQWLLFCLCAVCCFIAYLFALIAVIRHAFDPEFYWWSWDIVMMFLVAVCLAGGVLIKLLSRPLDAFGQRLGFRIPRPSGSDSATLASSSIEGERT